MVRNPFGVDDVPDPDGEDVDDFAASVSLSGSANDSNAGDWANARKEDLASIEGHWSSRWNAEEIEWQVGHGEIRLDEQKERVFILFDWDGGKKQGLIEARRHGVNGLLGRYLNLSAPEITRPWRGLVVDAARIDGRHSGGRIDFRR